MSSNTHTSEQSAADEGTTVETRKRGRLAEREYDRELVFGVGVVVGMGVFAAGIATLVLAMSVGLRGGGSYAPPTVEAALLAVGVALVVCGVALRLYRGQLSPARQSAAKTGGLVAVLAGLGLVLFVTAAESSNSAPYLVGPGEKVLLFAIAYGLIAVGLLLVRAAAKTVGW